MESLIEEHIKKFGKEPNIIGMFWNDNKKVFDEILKAIETNTPYDEYGMLSDEEKKAFDNRELFF